MNEVKHSPLPWGPEHNYLVDRHGKQILGPTSYVRDENDRDFIVQAVNSHEILVSTLINLLSELSATDVSWAIAKAIDEASAALDVVSKAGIR